MNMSLNEANASLIKTIRNRLGSCQIFGTNPKKEGIMIVECAGCLANGADLRALPKEHRQILLSAAAWHGREDVIDGLLAAGVDVNHQVLGAAPLHDLSNRFNPVIFDRLCSAGADVNQVSGTGSTLLHLLCAKESPILSKDSSRFVQHVAERAFQFVQHVAERGARLDVFDGKGLLPLHVAIEHGNVDACRLLMDLGVPGDARTASGVPATFMAAGLGYTEIAMALVRAGGSTEEKHNGRSLWGHAGAKKKSETARTLKDFCASIQALRAMDAMIPVFRPTP